MFADYGNSVNRLPPREICREVCRAFGWDSREVEQALDLLYDLRCKLWIGENDLVWGVAS